MCIICSHSQTFTQFIEVVYMNRCACWILQFRTSSKCPSCCVYSYITVCLSKGVQLPSIPKPLGQMIRVHSTLSISWGAPWNCLATWTALAPWPFWCWPCPSVQSLYEVMCVTQKRLVSLDSRIFGRGTCGWETEVEAPLKLYQNWYFLLGLIGSLKLFCLLYWKPSQSIITNCRTAEPLRHSSLRTAAPGPQSEAGSGRSFRPKQ